LNRLNTFLLVGISFVITILVLFLYLKETRKKEPETILTPLKIEAYRVDRHPLPDADVYLNQRFIGKTDEKGVFLKDLKLIVGESYALIIEKDRDGYLYGPWETHFTVEEEKKKRREKKREEIVEVPPLEGESDILTEIERAQLGKASLYEKYHFLAFIDGYMYYSIRVVGKNRSPVEEASVIVNGKEEGVTDSRGLFLVKYSGEDVRREIIQIFKEGEHIWMNNLTVGPNSTIDVDLNKMLLIDLFVYEENYDVIRGIEDVNVYLIREEQAEQRYVGKTDKEGYLSFAYTDDRDVDGYLNLVIKCPVDYLPEDLNKTYYIKRELPKLTVIDFLSRKSAPAPKVAVMPFVFKGNRDYFRVKQTQALKTSIEDQLFSKEVFLRASSRRVGELFKQFNIDYSRQNVTWKEMPLIKKAVDAIIIGEINGSDNDFDVKFYAYDYTGEKIFEIERKVYLRDFQALSEDIVQGFRSNFPYEGNISSIGEKIYVNLGRRQGINQNNSLYGFISYYDEISKMYSKKRVAKLRVIDTGEAFAAAELQDVNEGYLLEAGVKVKRQIEPVAEVKEVELTLEIVSRKKPVADVNIYIDDHWKGQTDEEGIFKMAVASNRNIDILAYKEGYIPGKINVKITEQLNSLRLTLRQGRTLFRVASIPEGALVMIDGEYKGVTPIIKNPVVVPYGFHLVELELEGYKRYRTYINFNSRRIYLTDNRILVLFWDYMKDAEEVYEKGDIEEAISILVNIPPSHPDYLKGLEFLGYINLKDVKNYEKSIEYFTKALEISNEEGVTIENVFTYYNLAQAYYNEAEKMFYENESVARYYYQQAISHFNSVKAVRNRIPTQNRTALYLDTLYYLAVSHQKLYYLTVQDEFLSGARFSWLDYFDFFDKKLLNDKYFRKQYSTAKSYRKEIKRLKGE
jgi:tetratricopeptide (TPR) repeat protein